MERGQASVETAILLPALVALALACWQALLVGWTSISAEHAVRAAARARLTGAAPRAAAARVLPGVMRNGLEVTTSGTTVTVRVRTPSLVPGFGMVVHARAAVVRQ
jgi:Flp pilus assembly protein TadG